MSKIDYSIVAIGPDNISGSRWQEFYELLLELKSRYKSSCRSASWENLKERMLSHIADDEHYHPGLVLEGEQLVGWADFSARNVGTSDQIVYPMYDLLPDRIPDGIIRALAEWVVEYMTRYDANIIYHMAQNHRYRDIDERWGGELFSHSQEYVLYRTSANRADIAKWIAAISHENPNLSMTIRDEMPDEYIDSYAQLLIEGSRDIPEESDSGFTFHIDEQEIRRQEQWYRANGVLSLRCFLHDDGGNLIGFTEAMANLGNPESVDQLMTTVRKSHRGCGLAKWLKGAIFLELVRRLPDFDRVVTWMRAINKPIQHINAQMGFVPGRQAHEFKIARSSIEGYLNQRSVA